MPEDRFLHPRLRRSRKVSTLTWFERCVWEDMMLGADDFGVLPYLPAKIWADNTAMMREPVDAVSVAMKNVVAAGLFLAFDHQGETYACDPMWQDFQKVSYPRRTYYPPPSQEIFGKLSTETCELLLKHHKGFPGNSLSVLRDGHRLRLKANGKRLTAQANGKGTEACREKPPAEFDAFYDAYPRKKEPGAALRAWLAATKKAPHAEIMAGLARVQAEFQSREPKYIPYPSSWLNGEGWKDQPTPPGPNPRRVNDDWKDRPRGRDGKA